MTSIVISYTGKSCKTGKALFNSLKQSRLFSRVKRVLRETTVPRSNVFLRWGNSVSNPPSGSLEVNSRQAVENASSKGKMIKILSDAGINVPRFLFVSNPINDEELARLRGRDGFLFIRQKNGVTRYDTAVNLLTDLYVTKPINKKREYRVHVFNNEIMGIYEKIPNDETVKLYKSSNCRFVKCNHTEEAIRCNKEAQQMCIDAVRSLGLTFGGVDIMREKRTKAFFITEVNSSPSLNTQNLQRFVGKLVDYLRRSNAL